MNQGKRTVSDGKDKRTPMTSIRLLRRDDDDETTNRRVCSVCSFFVGRSVSRREAMKITDQILKAKNSDAGPPLMRPC